MILDNIQANTLAGIDITKMDENLKIGIAVVAFIIIGFLFYYFISMLGSRDSKNKKNKKQK